jgi:hypothetical protein
VPTVGEAWRGLRGWLRRVLRYRIPAVPPATQRDRAKGWAATRMVGPPAAGRQGLGVSVDTMFKTFPNGWHAFAVDGVQRVPPFGGRYWSTKLYVLYRRRDAGRPLSSLSAMDLLA